MLAPENAQSILMRAKFQARGAKEDFNDRIPFRIDERIEVGQAVR